jgi:hypothetical protein
MFTMGCRKESLKIQSKAESGLLREAYLDAFVDRSSEHYRRHIATKLRFSDGEHYTGYLSDNVRNWERITSERFAIEIVRYPEVYVMADDHSRERVIGAPLWPFAPYSVVSLPPTLLLQLLPALPEDIYVFDSSVSWTLIRTHEHDAKRRICMAVGLTL